MKTILRFVILMAFLLTAPFLIEKASSQPHPNNQNIGGGTSGSGPIGGGAPIGSGLIMLICLGAGYGLKKVYDVKKRDLAD